MKPGLLILPPIKRGDTWGPFQLAKMNYKDGTEIEISSARMQIRTTSNDEIVFEATTADGSLVLSTVGTLLNIVTIQMVSDAATELFPVGTHKWDLEVRLTGGQVWTILGGPLPVSEDVTYT